VEQTGTLGARICHVERAVIPRKTIILETPYGAVPFKAAILKLDGGLNDIPNDNFSDNQNGKSQTSWLRPEHDAVANIAREQNLDYQSVYDQLMLVASRSTKILSSQ
jgi:uncharacterized protein (DUF111 family)